MDDGEKRNKLDNPGHSLSGWVIVAARNQTRLRVDILPPVPTAGLRF